MRKTVVLLMILYAVLLLAGCGPINQRLLDGTAIASGQQIDSPLSGGISPLDGSGGGDQEAEPTIDQDALRTQVQAQLDAVATSTPMAVPTDTVMPTPKMPTTAVEADESPTLSEEQIKFTALAETLSALGTGTLTATVGPTETPTATLEGPTQTPAPTEVPCLAFRLIAHVTYPPNTTVLPNTTFFKSWYVQNVGTCTWNNNYSLVFYDGFQLAGTTPLKLGAGTVVPPGKSVTLTIQLWTSPQSGTFTSLWMMADENGTLFGGGDTQNVPLEVRVVVPGQSPPEFTVPASTAPPFYTNTPKP